MSKGIRLSHIIAQITNPQTEALGDNSAGFLRKAIGNIAKKLNLHVIKVEDHSFAPQGYTVFSLLSESHMSLHTWPEINLIAFDLFTCKEVEMSAVKSVLLIELGSKETSTTISLIDRTSPQVNQ